MNFSYKTTPFGSLWQSGEYKICVYEEGTFLIFFQGLSIQNSPHSTLKNAFAACEKHKMENKVSKYLKLHKASGIKPGDWVEVVRTVPSFDKGWENDWPRDMNKLVGKKFKVTEDNLKNGFRVSGSIFRLPAHALRKLTRTVRPYTMTEFVCETAKRIKIKDYITWSDDSPFGVEEWT